jgi:hypothetical protein
MNPKDPRYLQHWQSGPDWRLKWARSLVGTRGISSADGMERLVFLTVACLRKAQSVRGANQDDVILLAQIYQVLELSPGTVARLKILVLGDVDRETICELTLVPREVLDVWVLLCFDIEDARKATSWIMDHVIRPIEEHDHGLACRLRIAHAGGPFVAQQVIRSECELFLDPAQQIIARQIQVGIQMDRISCMPWQSEKSRFQIYKLEANLHIKRGQIDLKRRALEQRYLVLQQRHELKISRLKIQEQRLAQRKSVLKDKADRRQIRMRALTVMKLERKKALVRAAQMPLARLRFRSNAGPGEPGQIYRTRFHTHTSKATVSTESAA